MSTSPDNYYSEPDHALRDRRFDENKSFFIDKFFPTNKSIRILDIGCGFGLFLEACARCGYKNYEGVDEGKMYVDYATKKLGLQNITCSNAISYLQSSKDRHYDIITIFNVLEHIPRNEVLALLELIHKKLSPNGTIMIEVPNAESPLGLATLYSDLTHEFAYTNKLLSHVLSLSGFSEIMVIPKYINSNKILRLAQKILARVIGLNNKLYFSGDIVAIAKKHDSI
ncbi:MAG: class I SAM-dependent methyltransferase [Patescibacteria group bacterium]